MFQGRARLLETLLETTLRFLRPKDQFLTVSLWPPIVVIDAIWFWVGGCYIAIYFSTILAFSDM